MEKMDESMTRLFTLYYDVASGDADTQRLHQAMLEDGIEINSRLIWSCLLHAAVEEKAYAFSEECFRNLKRCGHLPPGKKDYGSDFFSALLTGKWICCTCKPYGRQMGIGK